MGAHKFSVTFTICTVYWQRCPLFEFWQGAVIIGERLLKGAFINFKRLLGALFYGGA